MKKEGENSRRIQENNLKYYQEQLENQKEIYKQQIQETKDEFEKKRLEEKIKEEEEKNKKEMQAKDLFNKKSKVLEIQQENHFMEQFNKNRDSFCLKEIKQFDKKKIEKLINELNLSEKIPYLSLINLAQKSLLYNQNNNFNSIKHLNIILIGPTGVGKSTLINAILELTEEKAAKTQSGKPCTTEPKSYESEYINLRLIDTRGIEKSNYGINEVVNFTKEYIKKCIETGDPDNFIHCI